MKVQLDQKLLKRFSARSVPIEELEALETNCALKTFTYADAFELGFLIKSTAVDLFPERCVAIDISTATGLSLFRTVTYRGSSLDNEFWIQRKRKTALRFGRSTFYMGNKLGNRTPEGAFFVDSKEYAFHGGAVPIYLSCSDYPIGCLTVSGLKQEEDHLLAITCLKKFSSQELQHDLDLD